MNDSSYNPVQSMMDRMTTGGWDVFDTDLIAGLNRDAQLKRQAEAMAEAAPVLATFATPDGQLTLEWLVNRTLLRPPSDRERAAKTNDEYTIAAAERQGQNDIVRMILQAMTFAVTGKQQGPTT
jgi:hypothetical protein